MIRVKDIKQMQMNDFEETFRDVHDMVILSPTGLDAITENKIRLDLRKKDIRLKLVKNSLLRKVFDKLDVKIEGIYEGPTMLAWGGSSLKALSKELEKSFKGAKNVEFKTALAEGQQVSFKEALEMPTREEAIGEVVMLMLSPVRRLAGQLRGPAGTLAGQLKALAEKEGEGGGEAAA